MSSPKKRKPQISEGCCQCLGMVADAVDLPAALQVLWKGGEWDDRLLVLGLGSQMNGGSILLKVFLQSSVPLSKRPDRIQMVTVVNTNCLIEMGA